MPDPGVPDLNALDAKGYTPLALYHATEFRPAIQQILADAGGIGERWHK